ncbi:hypothetical protein KSS87_001889 [Heliosperma pusillum]|nr:hypothetical protein KSS87_015817 [Heliosperma pusillum]KAH9613385.1 hypothetical protein KSS87_001889 [Heliosperma pusillum]
MQTMGNEGRLIIHTSSYKCKQWVMKEDRLFTQRVTMQTMGNDGRLIVHKRSYNANIG